MGRHAQLGVLALSVLGFSLLGCGGPDSDGTGSDPDGTDRTTPSLECVAFDGTHDLIASCEAAIEDCPRTLDDFLQTYEPYGSASGLVLEGEGLRQIVLGYLGGVAYAFANDGSLAGWYAWNDIPWGPCASPYRYTYERGEFFEHWAPELDAHRCDLAGDARETGVLCDCPCPDPAPENGVVVDAGACLSIGRWPRCEETFVRQRELAMEGDSSMRSGCGLRTITIDANDCSYDASGALVGGERRRSDDPSNECPGVDVYRTGVLAACDEVTTCHFGEPPAGTSPCSLD